MIEYDQIRPDVVEKTSPRLGHRPQFLLGAESHIVQRMRERHREAKRVLLGIGLDGGLKELHTAVPEHALGSRQVAQSPHDTMPALDQPLGQRLELHEVSQAAAKFPRHENGAHD